MDKFPHHIRTMRRRDPCIITVPEERLYYLYSPFYMIVSDKAKFFYETSPDLLHWSDPLPAFDGANFWADMDFWAPEVHLYRGRYYLISSFRANGTFRRCQCLVSDSPRGPFEPHGNPLTPENTQALDGTLYVDRKNQPWLIYCKEWLQVSDGQICAIPLTPELTSAAGEERILFRGSDAYWRFTRENLNSHTLSRVTDGPYLHRCKNHELIMIWSSFSNAGYMVCCARSDNGEITGRWKQDDEVIYGVDGGHAMLFNDLDGKLMMTLHTPNISSQERLLIFEMDEKKGHLYTRNELTGNWYAKCYNPDGSMKPVHPD